jgi:hypothetical protein
VSATTPEAFPTPSSHLDVRMQPVRYRPHFQCTLIDVLILTWHVMRELRPWQRSVYIGLSCLHRLRQVSYQLLQLLSFIVPLTVLSNLKWTRLQAASGIMLNTSMYVSALPFRTTRKREIASSVVTQDFVVRNICPNVGCIKLLSFAILTKNSLDPTSSP